MSKVRRTIEELWEKTNAKRQDEKRLGLKVDEAIKYADKRNNAYSIPSLSSWISLHDEFSSWFISLATILLKNILVDQKSCRNEISALLVLSSAIVSHLLSIRRLVLAGHDVSAKQILRSLCEYADVMVLLILRPDLVPEFLEAQTPEKSNEFWHRHISKGKARKFIYNHIRNILKEQTAYKEMIEWRQEEDSILSMSAHPSSTAGFMTLCVPGANESELWPGFLGAKGEVSNRTLCYSIFAISDFLLLGGGIPFEKQAELPPLVIFDEEDELHRHVKYGREVLINLLLYIISEQDSKELSAHFSVDHWFEPSAVQEKI